MTVIAYRDGVMAGDSLLAGDNTVCAYVDKIRDINGYFVGICGHWGVASELFKWFEEECVDGPKRPPETVLVDDDKYPTMMLIVRKTDGFVWRVDGIGYPQEVAAPFFALGTGDDVAIGAMAMGADAETAVKVACEYDIHSGGKIKVLRRG